MKKILVTILVIAMMATVFTGCGGNTTSTTPEQQEPAAASEAAEYPSKSIQLIAPYKPGGDTDFNARIFAEYLQEELGETVVVVNVDGSGGVVGSRKVKDADPDGYTALFMHTALMVNEISGTADYGLDAFEYVATVGKAPGEIVCVNSKSGFKTFQDLIDYSKANPGKLNVAADMGTMSHIMAMMMQDAGAEINIISAGGASERVSQLKGGHIDVIINSYGTIKDYLTTGDFNALGMTNAIESKAFPEIRPLKEQGYDVVLPKNYFVAMPKGTPKEIVDKFAAAAKKVIENTEYQQKIYDAYGQEPFFQTPQEAQSTIDEVKSILSNYTDRFKSK